jgi:hypothetical protein
MGVRRDIEILRMQAQKSVAHATADQKRLKAGLV